MMRVGVQQLCNNRVAHIRENAFGVKNAPIQSLGLHEVSD